MPACAFCRDYNHQVNKPMTSTPNQNATTFDEGFRVSPIGYIRTPFVRAEGTPIQSKSSAGTEGVIELNPGLEPATRDLEHFERLWLLYLFHRASEPRLIVRPYLDPVEHGVFATRSPARPNRIGMSVVRLSRVEGLHLYVTDVDMLDGTPLLDIKPYVPAFDHFTVSQVGWYAGKSPEGVVADSRFESDDKR